MVTKNGNGWHQGDWTDPNDPDYIPKPEKLFLLKLLNRSYLKLKIFVN